MHTVSLVPFGTGTFSSNLYSFFKWDFERLITKYAPKYVDLVRICREAAKKYVCEWDYELKFLSVVGHLGPIFN
jgi:hypothetical protein